MIGDKLSDKKCAQKSRLRFFYAENNFDKQVKKNFEIILIIVNYFIFIVFKNLN